MKYSRSNYADRLKSESDSAMYIIYTLDRPKTGYINYNLDRLFLYRKIFILKVTISNL